MKALRLPEPADFSLFQRIVLANTLVILLGAVGGTLLTRHLVGRVADSVLILIFLAVGTTLSVAVNCTLVSLALRPLYALVEQATEAVAGNGYGAGAVVSEGGPEVYAVSEALFTLLAQLRARNQELQALSRRTLHAQEAERKRIARSLHDDTGQRLSLLLIQLERLQRSPPPDGSALREQLDQCQELARQTVQELRNIMEGLRPSILDDLGLVPAIRSYSRRKLADTGIGVTLNLPDGSPPLPPEHALALFRIVQEALQNVVRHAEADEVRITLRQGNGRFCLLVEDDGRGFVLETVARNAVARQQLGLLGMAERAELSGATFSARSAPGEGTSIQVCLPVAKPAGAEKSVV